MKLKVISLTILLMLLLAPLGQLVYAQDTGDDGTGDDGTGDDGKDYSSGDDGGEDEGDGNIDPLVYQQIRETAQLRYQELYELMFGTTSTDDSTGKGDADDGTGDGEDDIPYDGPEIPEDVDPALRNAFMHAWQAMQQAEEQEEINPKAAANAYMRSLKQLRNAYRKYEKDHPEVADGLKTPEGDMLPEEEVPDEPTEEEITETQKRLVERFQERFQERLTAMYENYNGVEGGLSPGDAVKALNALRKAEEKLLRIKERIDSGDVDGALDDLDETGDEMDDDFGSMEDAAASQMFRTMNKLEERIQKMEEKAARKAARGEDTSEEDALLADLRGNKNKTKDDYKTNKGKSGTDKETGKPDK